MKRIELLVLAEDILSMSGFTIHKRFTTEIPLATVLAKVIGSAIITVQLQRAHEKAGAQLKDIKEMKFIEADKLCIDSIIAKKNAQKDFLKALETQLLKFVKEYEFKEDEAKIAPSPPKAKLNNLISRLLNPKIILNKHFPDFLSAEITPTQALESLCGMLCLDIDARAQSLKQSGLKKTFESLSTMMNTVDSYSSEPKTPENFALQNSEWNSVWGGWSGGAPDALKQLVARYNHIKLSRPVFLITVESELVDHEPDQIRQQLAILEQAHAQWIKAVEHTKKRLNIDTQSPDAPVAKAFQALKESEEKSSASIALIKPSFEAVAPFLPGQYEVFAFKFQALHPQSMKWSDFMKILPGGVISTVPVQTNQTTPLVSTPSSSSSQSTSTSDKVNLHSGQYTTELAESDFSTPQQTTSSLSGEYANPLLALPESVSSLSSTPKISTSQSQTVPVPAASNSTSPPLTTTMTGASSSSNTTTPGVISPPPNLPSTRPPAPKPQQSGGPAPSSILKPNTTVVNETVTPPSITSVPPKPGLPPTPPSQPQPPAGPKPVAGGVVTPPPAGPTNKPQNNPPASGRLVIPANLAALALKKPGENKDQVSAGALPTGALVTQQSNGSNSANPSTPLTNQPAKTTKL